LQPIVFPEPANVSTTSSVVFTVDPSVGPNSDQYFVRFTSTTLNQNGTSNPYLSFSAKFTLDNMRGTFNASVQAQISSASSSASSTAAPSGSTSRSSTSTSRSSTSTSSTGGAAKNTAGMFAAGVAVAAGVVALF
jgi:hypothetical protein